MLRGAMLALIAWLGLAGAGMAQAPAPAAVPAASIAPGVLTFPALTGRVVDDAGVLSEAQRAELTDALAALEARTTDQLVVVTLRSLQGRPIEEYGYQLGRHWGIGQKDKDSGALLIVVPSEHRVRIEVGYGLEGTLTDAATEVIIQRTILPAFRSGDLAGGIRSGTMQLIQLLEGGAAPAAAPQDAGAGAAAGAAASADRGLTWPMIFLAVAVVGLLLFCAIHGGGLCRGLMQVALLMALSNRNGSSREGSSFSGGGFSGGGGSFGGGGSSGSW